jgi:hypothetical protein
MNKSFSHPCPICKLSTTIIGEDAKGFKLTACSHKFKFKRTKSQKIAEREWVRTPWGLERASAVKA